MIDFSPTSWIDLTSRQRSIWLDVTASDNHRLFQVGACTRVSQDIDIKVLRNAVIDVTRRHDALRLIIDTHEPRQRIEAAPCANVQSIDFSHEAEPDTAVLTYIDQLFTSPFDLGERPLVQVVVASVGDGCNWLILRIHHVIIDAISFSLTFKDVIDTYNSLLAGTGAGRPRSSYLLFQKQDALYSSSERAKRDLKYWQDRLSDLPGPLFQKQQGERISSAGRPLLRRKIDFASCP